MSTPLWLDEPYAARPPLDGDARADVCVVGGGAGGLATVWRLVEEGVTSIVLLDAGEIAGAASGRNGGLFIAGAAPMYHEARSDWGAARAAAIYRATLDAQLEMLAAAEEVGARGHFRMVGMRRHATDAAEAADVRTHQAALAADGFAGHLDGDDLILPHDGAVHPVRWLRALAAAAAARGVRVHEHTRVTAVEPDATVRTARGVVRAERVVVAIDAGLAALVEGAQAVRPRRLNMLATAPVGQEVLPTPVYARYGYEYLQQTADGRIAAGGFSDLDGDASWTSAETVSEPVQRRLERYLNEEYGVRAPVTHRWAGVVGYVEGALPRCGAVPGTDGRVLALGGYNGTGHVQAWVAARAALAGDGSLYAEPVADLGEVEGAGHVDP